MRKIPTKTQKTTVSEILIINESPIREEVMRSLKQARKELDQLTFDWAVFLEKDKPAYSSWLQVTFHEVYKKLNEIEWKILEKRVVIEAVIREASYLGITYSEAYERISSGNRQAPTLEEFISEASEAEEEEAARELFEEELQNFGIDPYTLDPSEWQMSFEAFKSRNGFTHGRTENDSDSVEEEEEEQDSSQDWDEESLHGKFRAAQSDHDDYTLHLKKEWLHTDLKRKDRLRRLYRTLARRLHPDMGAPQNPEIRSLWLQVQSAYQTHDIARLEGILLLLGGEAPELDSTENASISELKNALEEVKASTSELKKKIAEARRDRAWGFSRPGSQLVRTKVYRIVKNEMDEKLNEAVEALEALNQFLENNLKAAA
jgi:hypothetical protein